MSASTLTSSSPFFRRIRFLKMPSKQQIGLISHDLVHMVLDLVGGNRIVSISVHKCLPMFEINITALILAKTLAAVEIAFVEA